MRQKGKSPPLTALQVLVVRQAPRMLGQAVKSASMSWVLWIATNRAKPFQRVQYLFHCRIPALCKAAAGEITITGQYVVVLRPVLGVFYQLADDFPCAQGHSRKVSCVTVVCVTRYRLRLIFRIPAFPHFDNSDILSKPPRGPWAAESMYAETRWHPIIILFWTLCSD